MIMLWNPTLLLVLLIFLLFPRFLLACCLCVTLHFTFLLNLIQQRRAKVIYITVLRIPENQVEDENLSVFSLMVKTKLKQNGKIKTLQRTLSAAKRIWWDIIILHKNQDMDTSLGLSTKKILGHLMVATTMNYINIIFNLYKLWQALSSNCRKLVFRTRYA